MRIKSFEWVKPFQTIYAFLNLLQRHIQVWMYDLISDPFSMYGQILHNNLTTIVFFFFWPTYQFLSFLYHHAPPSNQDTLSIE